MNFYMPLCKYKSWSVSLSMNEIKWKWTSGNLLYWSDIFLLVFGWRMQQLQFRLNGYKLQNHPLIVVGVWSNVCTHLYKHNLYITCLTFYTLIVRQLGNWISCKLGSYGNVSFYSLACALILSMDIMLFVSYSH